MRPVDPRLLKYAAAARSFFAVGGVLAVAQTGVVIAFSFLVTQVIVRAIAGESLASLVPVLVALAGVVVVRFLVTWGADANAVRGAAVVKSELRQRVLAAITRLGPGWLGSRNSTAVGVVVGPGLDALDTYFSRYLPQLILTAIAMPITVVVIWAEDWISGLTVALTLPLIPVFMILIGWATQTVQTKQWQKLGRLSTAFLDVVGGLSTLTIFGRQHRQAARIRAVTDDYRVQTMRVLRVSFLSGFALELAASLSVALVAVSIGVRLIDGSLALGVGLFVLLLAPEAFLPLRNVGAQFHAAADGVAAADDVFAILDAGADVPLASQGAPGGAGSNGFRGLEVRGLTVRRGGTAVVEGLDARFARGAVTAVIGPSGSGKSSLVAALLGFVPADGCLELDGRDVAGDPVPRDWLAWAAQRATLLPGTVAENVALGAPDLDEALARAALELVGAASVSLSTPVDPRGGGLSGGQAQRVALARAVYRARRLDSAVVVVDEPTSALDDETEGAVIRCLRTLADEGRAVIVVSHRRAVIAAADTVLALDRGVAAVPSAEPTSHDDGAGDGDVVIVAEPRAERVVRS